MSRSRRPTLLWPAASSSRNLRRPGEHGNEVLLDRQRLAIDRLSVLELPLVADQVAQVEEVTGQFRTQLVLVGEVGDSLLFDGDGIAEGRLRFL